MLVTDATSSARRAPRLSPQKSKPMRNAATATPPAIQPPFVVVVAAATGTRPRPTSAPLPPSGAPTALLTAAVLLVAGVPDVDVDAAAATPPLPSVPATGVDDAGVYDTLAPP